MQTRIRRSSSPSQLNCTDQLANVLESPTENQHVRQSLVSGHDICYGCYGLSAAVHERERESIDGNKTGKNN
eukprot:4828885-Amphidinium_carterae.1